MEAKTNFCKPNLLHLSKGHLRSLRDLLHLLPWALEAKVQLIHLQSKAHMSKQSHFKAQTKLECFVMRQPQDNSF
jgi:hypothetical protein